MSVDSNSDKNAGSPRNTEPSGRNDTTEEKLIKAAFSGDVDWATLQNEKLIRAALSGDVGRATLLLSDGANLQYIDKNGFSAAYWAATNGFNDILTLFLQHNLDINSKCGDETLLMSATNGGHCSTVELLASSGADLDYEVDELTVAHTAASEGRDDILEIFLRHGLDVNIKTSKGSTPIHLAAIYGHINTVKMLANHGAVLDLQNIYGNTALMLASGAGQLETALVLLLGADASKKTDDSDDGKTAENVAYNCHHRSLAFMIYLWNEYHKDFNKLMFNYAVSGIDAAFRRLIEQGGDINYTNEDGRTGFAMAAARGHVAVVRTYLKNGMDVHTRSGQDQQKSSFI